MSKAIHVLQDSIAHMKMRLAYAYQARNSSDIQLYTESLHKLEDKLQAIKNYAKQEETPREDK